MIKMRIKMFLIAEIQRFSLRLRNLSLLTPLNFWNNNSVFENLQEGLQDFRNIQDPRISNIHYTQFPNFNQKTAKE